MRRMSDDVLSNTPLRAGRTTTTALLAALHFPHLCDLYRPVSPSVLGTGIHKDITYTLFASRVKCHLEITPEVDFPMEIGRTKETNIFTLDKFYFPRRRSDGRPVGAQVPVARR